MVDDRSEPMMLAPHDQQDGLDRPDGAEQGVVPPMARRSAAERGTHLASMPSARWQDGRLRALLATLVVVLPTVIAFLISNAAPKVFEARTELLVASPANSSAADQNIATQLTLLTSKAVLGPAARAGDVTEAHLLASVSATRENDSQVLQLSVTDHDAQHAVALAQAIVKNYLAVAEDATGASPDVTFLQSRIDELTKNLQDLDQRTAAGAPSDNSTQRELLLSQISNLQNQLTTAQLGAVQAAEPARVVTQPYALSDAVSPHPMRAALGGLVAGLLLLVIAIFLLRRQAAGTREK